MRCSFVDPFHHRAELDLALAKRSMQEIESRISRGQVGDRGAPMFKLRVAARWQQTRQ